MLVELVARPYLNCSDNKICLNQHIGNTETGPRFKVSSERTEEQGIEPATPALEVQRANHYTTTAPAGMR